MICAFHVFFLFIAKKHDCSIVSSRVDGRGTNAFDEDGVAFGWEPIEDMLHREVQRRQSNQLPRVPGLKENFVFRDPWTRLNVKPAKIMQVRTLSACIEVSLIQQVV